MDFRYSNSKAAMLIAVSGAKTYSTYEKNKRREKWLESIMNFIGNTEKIFVPVLRIRGY